MSDNHLWNKILRYISKRERCEKEVREYLKRISVGARSSRPMGGKTPPLQSIEEIIQKLKSLDFLNEERFTKAYIHDNYQLKHKGKNRIRQELKNKEINEEIIDKYLNKIGNKSEAGKALELALKRREFMKKIPVLAQKRRLYGFLIRRGFSPQITFHVIDKIFKERYNLG
jgi:regulatory protein